ncbi:MAG: hypothetical protein IJA07_08045 [Agathobacter sp.]|nr:hypothetical protein [Agathobacter sp.]
MGNEKLEVLYDHYKDTYALSKEAQVRRNKGFVGLCVLEAISFSTMTNQGVIFDIIRSIISTELQEPILLGNTILQTLLWVFTVYVMIRYIQDTLYVERHYSYLKQLEKEISDLLGKDIFTREGKNYKKDFPIVLKIIEIFYKILMPVLFLVINSVKIYQEWGNIECVTISIILDTILYVAIFLITWFYFFEINEKITKFCKQHIPFVNQIAANLRTFLLESSF